MKKKNDEKVVAVSGKKWLNVVKKVAGVAFKISAFLVTAPIKLPVKVLQVAKYLIVAAGVVRAIESKKEGNDE